MYITPTVNPSFRVRIKVIKADMQITILEIYFSTFIPGTNVKILFLRIIVFATKTLINFHVIWYLLVLSRLCLCPFYTPLSLAMFVLRWRSFS